MKKYLFLTAATALALASCTNDDYVGSENPGGEVAIGFGAGNKAFTRAALDGAAAATKLGNNFVVMGVKGDGTNQTAVFDHYNVNYVTGSGTSTTTNTAGWEYVNQTPTLINPVIQLQDIKYWDYAASQYDFIAYSLGGNANLEVSAITPATLGSAAYKIYGTAADLTDAYIADLVTAYNTTKTPAQPEYKNEVEFKFRSLAAKARVGLYETIPGYSVKDVVFYTDASTAATDGNAYLYTTSTDVFNSKGTYTVYFPTTGNTKLSATDYNKAHVSFAATDLTGTAVASATDTKMSFGALDNFAGVDKYEATGSYLGRTSADATYAGAAGDNYYVTVIPNETGATLNLKVNYTLVSRDGSGEEINVVGANAQVPAKFGTWKSGYAYTYIFKISDNTNGTTGGSTDPAGLYPITFDAIVTETEEGVQETITEVATPSITTYAKGVEPTATAEYSTGKNIYVSLEDPSTETLTDANTKLYTVTLTATDTYNPILGSELTNGNTYYTAADGTGEFTANGSEDAGTTFYVKVPAAANPAQTINEASVANCIAQGGSVTDANSWTLEATDVTSTLLSIETEIAADDATDGNAVSGNFAMFKPTVAGTYAFEYNDGAKKHYKIIIVH